MNADSLGCSRSRTAAIRRTGDSAGFAPMKHAIEVQGVTPAERFGREQARVVRMPQSCARSCRGRAAPVVGRAHGLALRGGPVLVGWAAHGLTPPTTRTADATPAVRSEYASGAARAMQSRCVRARTCR